MKNIIIATILILTGVSHAQKLANADGSNLTQPAFRNSTLPSQTGQAGEYLKTDGTAASWESVTSNLTSGPVTSSGGVSAIADGALSIAKTSGLQTALDAKLSTAVQAASESLASAILFHDDCTGSNQTLAVSGTRTVSPGPGTMTVGDSLTNGIRRYENGKLLLSPLPEGTSTQVSMICGGSRTVAAGLTIMARVRPGWRPGVFGSALVGFSSISTGNDLKRGCMIHTYGTAPYANGEIGVSTLSSTTDGGHSTIGVGISNPGEEIGLAVKYVSDSRQQYYMQGGRATELGYALGSNDWMLVGETFTTLSGTVYPLVSAQWGGVSEFSNIKVLSSWSPSNRHQFFDFERVKIGVHIPSLGRDPVTGLAVLAWNNGTTHVNVDTAIKASVRLSDGTWTAPSTIVAAPGSGGNVHIESLSSVNGSLRLVYNKNAVLADGGTQYWRTVSINSSTGAITLGTEALMGISATGGSKNLGLSPIITLASGRLVRCYGKEDGVPYVSYCSWSDDNGATWTQAAISATLPADASLSFLGEPSCAVESDGAVGCIMRSSGGVRSAYYSRCALPNATPMVWSMPVEVPSIPMPSASSGSRAHMLRLSSGQLIVVGNDSNAARNKLTLWKLSDGGVVTGKISLGDFGSPTVSTTMQYPDVLEDGDNLLIAYSHQFAGSATAGIGIRLQTRRWASPIAVETGGTGRQDVIRPPSTRVMPTTSVWLAYGATPTPDLSLGNHFNITLTGTGNTLQAPTTPMPWSDVTVVFVQGSGGLKSILFHADYEFGGITPVWLTAANATNTLRAYYNPITRKWVVTGWN